MNASERKKLLKPKDSKDCPASAINNDDSETHDDNEEDDGHSWWASDSGSSTGSYYSDETDESSIIEWESGISSTGEVFYIESSPYHYTHDSSNEHVAATVSPPPLPAAARDLRRRASTRAGKLMRFIRRRESKRYNSTRINKKSKNSSKFEDNSIQHKERNANKEVKFHDCQAGEIREVMLRVDPEKHYKLGRRASLCEAYLGIIPGDFSDKIRVMVAGFIPDSEAMENKNIKIGDWLRSINSQEITTKNLRHILLEITSPTIIKLELQRVAGVEVTSKVHQVSNVPKQTPFVRRLINKEESNKNMESLIDYSFGVIYLQISGLTENGPELQGVTYTYPRSSSSLSASLLSKSKKFHSILCLARGAFITLNHMLPETIAAKPISTTISVGSEEIHILYSHSSDEELFLLAIPARWSSLEESTEIFSNIIRSLEFTYKSLNNCFNKAEHYSALDHFFYLNFTKLLQQQQQQQLQVDADLDEILENSSIKKTTKEGGGGGGGGGEGEVKSREKCQFENIISATRMIILPRDAQIQIDAALNEMEAMDYRDWNEDPIDCQRLYTILGSCLYYKSNLLASHLPRDDLVDVLSFLRHNGLIHLMEKESIESLVIWRSVYPYSCCRNRIKNIEICDKDDDGMNSKWFLLLVGFGFEYLAVLFENGGCTVQPHNNTQGPDIFYVEEVQETLKHIQKIGVPTLAAKWISANARPEIIDIRDRHTATVKISGTITENFLGLAAKTPDNIVVSPAKTLYANSTESKKIPAVKVVTSILKKPSPEPSPIMSKSGKSVYSLQTSEDSMSQDGGGTEAISEMSDETAPILGRRATRERNLAAVAANRQSDDSDSDVDIYRNESTTNSMNLVVDIRENLLNQAEYIAPTKLTAGNKNCLLHYINLDSLNGILLSSSSSSNSSSSSSSSSSSRIIENLGKNSKITATFNECAYIIHKLLNNTMRFKKILNKDVDKTVINKNLVAVKEHGVLFEYNNLDFWVVGRLYAAPYVKEFYVCYEDTIPQNLVEMAFKLNTI